MTTDARARYLDVLLKRLEAHEGPVADAERYMERLDVLAGVDVAQKQLTAGTPPIEGSTTVIEHGSEGQTGDSVSDSRPPTVSAGPEHRAVLHDPASSLPVVHEDSLQVRDETEISAPPPSVPPAAPSPAPAPPLTSHDRRDPQRGRRSNKERRACDCGCGAQLTVWPYEMKAKPNGPFYLNREHAAAGRRILNAQMHAAEVVDVDKPMDTTPAPSDVTQIHQPATFDVTNVEEPARGLAAIAALPPVEEAPPMMSKFVCKCPAWWRQKTAGWHEEIPNEGHHDDCPLYRKGGHRWPMPAQGSERNEPFTIRCGWCGDTREVDRYGVEWVKSDLNPINNGKVPEPSHV